MARLKVELKHTGELPECHYGFRGGRQGDNKIKNACKIAEKAAAYAHQHRRCCCVNNEVREGSILDPSLRKILHVSLLGGCKRHYPLCAHEVKAKPYDYIQCSDIENNRMNGYEKVAVDPKENGSSRHERISFSNNFDIIDRYHQMGVRNV